MKIVKELIKAAEAAKRSIMILSADGETISLSGRAAEFFGLSGSELDGFDFFDRVKAPELKAFLAAAAKKNGQIKSFSVSFDDITVGNNPFKCEFSFKTDESADKKYCLVEILPCDRLKILEEKSDVQRLSCPESSGAKLRDVLDVISDGFALTDLSGRIIKADEKLAKLYGFQTAEEIKGLCALDFMLPEEVAGASAEIARTIETDVSREYRYIAVKKDGTQFEASVSAVVVRDESGKPAALMGVTRDLDARARVKNAWRESEALKESEKKYRQLVESLQEGIWQIDENAVTTYVNCAMAEMLGYRTEEMLGRHLFDFMDEEQKKYAEKNLAKRKSGIKERHDFKFKKKDGSPIWVSILGNPIFDDNRVYKGSLGAVMDVTERRTMEENLVKSERFLESIIENIPDMVFLKDAKELRFVKINKTGEYYLGISRQELYGKNDYDFFDKEQADFFTQKDREALNSKSIADIPEEKITSKTLGERILRTKKIPILDENGEPEFLLGISEDVTEQKKVESELNKYRLDLEALVAQRTEELARGEEKFRLIANYGHDWENWVSPDGRLLWINKGAEKLTGYSLDELYAMQDFPMPLIHDSDKEFMRNLFAEAVKGSVGNDVIFKAVTKQGTEKWAAVSWQPVYDSEGRFIGHRSSVRDVSERKRAEEALKENEARWRALLDILTDGFVITDLAGNAISVDRRLAELQGYDSPDEMIGLNIFDFVLPEDAQRAMVILGEMLTNQGSAKEVEYTAVKRDGSTYPASITGALLYDAQGEPAGLMSVVKDLSESRRAQNELRESEERYRKLIESSPDAILVHTADAIVFANPAASKMFKVESPELLIGRNIYELLHPDYRELARTRLEKVYGEGKPSGRVEEKVFAVDGSIVEVELETMLIVFNGKPSALSVLRDITLQRLLESEVQKTQKLEAVGLLAGGIAHDFNNLLSGMLGNISLAQIYSRDNPDVQMRLREAEKAVGRARDLTNQLLTFSRGGAPVKKAAKLSSILIETTNFALHGSSARSEFEIADDLWAADVDLGQISQVIHNVALNAHQAMPEGGVISVKAENSYIDASNAVPLSQGRYVKITIKDQGNGIEPENIERIFDPYFTTKPKGSGLGLAVCHSIIKKHGGIIKAESEVGVGSQFVIYLPASVSQPEEKAQPKAEIKKGAGRILLMDDDRLILDIGSEILELLGYLVEIAADGQTAVEIYKKNIDDGSPFDAVIVDLTVPGGMGGKDAAKKLLEIDPNARVIVSSGYSNDPILSQFTAHGFCGILPKPYSAKELGETLNSVLKKPK